MEKHLRILSVLFIVFGSLQFIVGIFVWVYLGSTGLMTQEAGGAFAGGARTIGTLLGVAAIVMGLASLAGAVGLMKSQRWARVLLLVLSFLDLVSIPLGTALGIYGIWVLMKDETDALFPGSQSALAHHGPTAGR